MNNNLYYSDGNDSALLLRNDNGTQYTFGQWENYWNGTDFDSKSPEPSDPLFVNPDLNDFSLKSASPAIGAGIKIDYISTDYDGITYSNPPSLGAIEY